MSIPSVFLSGLIGYFLGCIHPAFILGKAIGKIDIREHGTNNAGASNMATIMGWKYGIITALIDIFKATLAVIITKSLFPDSIGLLFVAGTLAIIGHIFPVFLGFRGGKGTASLVGMALGIDLRIAIILVLSIIVITFITDYIAIGSLVIFVLLPILTYIYGYPLISVLLGMLLALLAFYKHSINIKRIINHNEIGLRAVAKKNREK